MPERLQVDERLWKDLRLVQGASVHVAVADNGRQWRAKRRPQRGGVTGVALLLDDHVQNVSYINRGYLRSLRKTGSISYLLAISLSTVTPKWYSMGALLRPTSYPF